MGGDETTAIDAAAERVVLAHFQDSTTSRSCRKRPASPGRADPHRRRPDRRLAEREARHRLLLAVDRRRLRPDDGRRPLRLRPRLRHRGGVDGDARRAARASTDSPRRRRAEGADRDPRLRGDAYALVAEKAAPWSTSPIACASWARWRSRSATSPPAASTRLLAEAARRSTSRQRQLLVLRARARRSSRSPRRRSSRLHGLAPLATSRPRPLVASSASGNAQVARGLAARTSCPLRLLRVPWPKDRQAHLARPGPLSRRRDHEGRSVRVLRAGRRRRSCRTCATGRSR